MRHATHPSDPDPSGDRRTAGAQTDARHGGRTPEDGSLVTEYGLIAIVGATIASLAIKWASGGAIWELFDAVTSKVRVLLGA